MADRHLVISKEELQAAVNALGARISADYAGTDLVLIGVLNGAFIFLADLARAITIPHQIDFIRVASYGQSNSSSGTIRIGKDSELDIRDKHVLLVEDIVDTGTTLAWLIERFKDRQAASVKICALIDKKERRKTEVPLDYLGFVRDGFLVGYGLDFAEQYRSLPEIYSLSFP